MRCPVVHASSDLTSVSLACGARQNASMIADELETDPSRDAPAPAGPTQTLHSSSCGPLAL